MSSKAPQVSWLRTEFRLIRIKYCHTCGCDEVHKGFASCRKFLPSAEQIQNFFSRVRKLSGGWCLHGKNCQFHVKKCYCCLKFLGLKIQINSQTFMFWGWIIMFLGWNFFRANPLVEVVSSGITLIDTYNDTLNYLENCWRDIYFALVGGAATHHRKVFTEFCKSSNHKSVNELIQLENMERVRHGAIHMPESYGNTTEPKRCVVTLSGPRNGIIIFKRTRG